jgi:predicted dinucleotide-binding enzyme
MRVGVLGTGIVGKTLSAKLRDIGEDVRVGSRSADNPDSDGTFADAAAFGELVINATAGTASLQALEAAGADNLAGKVLLDVANPLDASKGFPPTLAVCNDDSLAEQIQRGFPDARVVKSLHTVNADVMVRPGIVPGDHQMFVAGDDDEAKQTVREMLESFGWPTDRILDLGGIRAARGTEMYLPLWLGLFQAVGTPRLNIAVHVARG